MGSDREEVIDVRSGLAYLMVKWRWIVLAALIGALAAGGFAYMKNHRKAETGGAAEVTYEEKAAKLRAALQESDALYVEQLVTQYKSYGEKLAKWGQYTEGAVLQKLDPYNYIKKDVQYAVLSDNSSAVNAFTSSLLGQAEYEKIGELTGFDPLTASLQEIVTVTDAALISSSVADPGNEIVNTPGDINAGSSGSRIIDVTILAPDEEQADGIGKIADAAVNDKCARMKSAGMDISVRKISDTSVRNDANWLLNRQMNENLPRIQMQSNRSAFIKNSVDTLTEGQKDYFTFLCKDQTASTGAKVSVKKVNLKKYAAAGCIAGLMIALIAVYLSYIFTDKIRTEEELRDNYRLPILQKFDISAPDKGLMKTDPIRRKGLSILGADRAAVSAEKGAALLEAELGRRLSREDCSSLYIAYDCEEERVRGTVETLAGKLSGGQRRAEAGNPTGDDGAYQKLLGADAVVIAETLNRSGKKPLKELIETCRRNGIKVLGCVTLMDTQNY